MLAAVPLDGDGDAVLVVGDGVGPRVGDNVLAAVPPSGEFDALLVGVDAARVDLFRDSGSESAVSEGDLSLLGPLLDEARIERADKIERNRQAILRWQKQSVEMDLKHAHEIESLKKTVPGMIVEGLPSVSSFRRRTNEIAEDCKILELENKRLCGRRLPSTDMHTHFSKGTIFIASSIIN